MLPPPQPDPRLSRNVAARTTTAVVCAVASHPLLCMSGCSFSTTKIRILRSRYCVDVKLYGVRRADHHNHQFEPVSNPVVLNTCVYVWFFCCCCFFCVCASFPERAVGILLRAAHTAKYRQVKTLPKCFQSVSN